MIIVVVTKLSTSTAAICHTHEGNTLGGRSFNSLFFWSFAEDDEAELLLSVLFVRLCRVRGTLSALASTSMRGLPSLRLTPTFTLARPLCCSNAAPSGSRSSASRSRHSRAVSGGIKSVHVSVVSVLSTVLSALASSLLWLLSVFVRVFTERQLTTDRTSSAMRAKLNSLNSTRKAVDRTSGEVVFRHQFFGESRVLFIFLLRFHQQPRHVLVHRLVGVVYTLGTTRRVSLAVGYPGDGGTDAARWYRPLDYLHDCVRHRLSLVLKGSYCLMPISLSHA